MSNHSRELQHRLCVRAIILAAVLCVAGGAFAQEADVEIDLDHGCTGWQPGSEFVNPKGIFFDVTRGECYVADTGNHQVVVCDEHGIPRYRFTHYVPGNGGPVPGEPKCIAVDENGSIYLVDEASEALAVLDATGRLIDTIAPPADGCGVTESFEYVALGPDGVYASLSCAKRRVAVIDGDLNISRVITLGWKEPSERACITGLAIDSKGGIYVTDACASEMVQMYDANGGFLRAFGSHETGLENFSFASGVALRGDGNMWIVDTLRHVVSLFTPEGTRLATVGGKGAEPGAMQYPTSVAADGSDRVFVTERIGNRYQCFRVKGEVPRGDLQDQNQLGMLLEEVGND
jgi:DNA-binding beta-propeller fold protein YncE